MNSDFIANESTTVTANAKSIMKLVDYIEEGNEVAFHHAIGVLAEEILNAGERIAREAEGLTVQDIT